MRKFIYLSIVERLSELKNPDGEQLIKHFDLWNNNLEYIEDEQPFNTPAVFVEFQSINWRYQANKLYNTDLVAIRLHIVTQRNAPSAHNSEYEEHAIAFFDIIDLIRKTLIGFECKNETGVHGPLFNVQSDTDNNAAELRNDIEIFTCTATDYSFVDEPKHWIAANIKINIE
ncbi:MAG: hypothetical protein LBC68_07080 [Prevotellaceae bacterium]|jgi:hypothetical protein|nr:hypothetical protein [Prevotellaceae bacterium]